MGLNFYAMKFLTWSKDIPGKPAKMDEFISEYAMKHKVKQIMRTFQRGHWIPVK
jgi:hypothetical protein